MCYDTSSICTNDNTNFIKSESVNSICSPIIKYFRPTYFNLSNCFWNHSYLPSLAYVSTFNPVLLSSSTTHFHSYQVYRLQGNFIIFLPFSRYRFRQTLLFRRVSNYYLSCAPPLFHLLLLFFSSIRLPLPYFSTTSPPPFFPSPSPSSFNTPCEPPFFHVEIMQRRRRWLSPRITRCLIFPSDSFFPFFFFLSLSLPVPFFFFAFGIACVHLVWRWDVS